MKSKKLLSSLMALSIIATSSLALGTNVQAKSVENAIRINASQRSIIAPNQKYTYCGKISYEAIPAIEKYFEKSGDKASATDVRNILLQNGMNRSLANNLSYSIYDQQMETKAFTMALGRTQYGAEVVQCADGTYTLINIWSENEPIESYSFYGLLEPGDTALIRDYLKSDKYDGEKGLTQYLIDKNIVSDPVVANKLGCALATYAIGAFDELVRINQNILVLKSDDGNYYKIAFKSK